MARTVVVASGDTLSKIAEKYYGNASFTQKLANYNGITNPNLIQIGETLQLPSLDELDGTKIVAKTVQSTIATPNGLDELINTFGNIAAYIREDGHLKPEWESEHLASATLPFSIPLSWDRSQKVSRIYCHKLLAPVVTNLFAEIVKRELKNEIKTFGGCFNYRPKRQSSKFSTHCWGIAIDLNPETNQQGSAGNMPAEIVALFREYGFKWRGDWSGNSKDPMHFQYCTGY